MNITKIYHIFITCQAFIWLFFIFLLILAKIKKHRYISVQKMIDRRLQTRQPPG